MFKNFYLLRNMEFAAAAAIIFCIPVMFYINSRNYTQSWLIYLGSFLFCGVITVYTLFFNKSRNDNTKVSQMILAALLTVIMGVILSGLICFILLMIMVPGYPVSEFTGTISQSTPVNVVHGKMNGMGFRIFIGALLINLIIGGFVGGLFPFYLKRDQTR